MAGQALVWARKLSEWVVVPVLTGLVLSGLRTHQPNRTLDLDEVPHAGSQGRGEILWMPKGRGWGALVACNPNIRA